ncbi:MAG TPA: MerR family transcriptional regulator [Acidimicrobiales bacterium]|nr:MerR family transcriptional regulator [Acidimicrobiales bacterium]
MTGPGTETPVGERAYLSIGEVLTLLKEEFPDVTISKIRFLESQGLLDPERTPSGYRKFYDTDVERLRWILQQQRENFLPLKVIKGRLAPGAEPDAEDEPGATMPTAEPAGPSEVAAPDPPAATSAPARQTRVVRTPPPRPAAPAGGDVSMTIEELVEASGLPAPGVRELEKYGMLAGRKVAGVVYYDDEALTVATLAAGFAQFGVEARHLRMYKNAAEREVGFFEQVVMPLLKQRNPDSRRQAMATLAELGTLGEGLRAALLRQALKDHTGA